MATSTNLGFPYVGANRQLKKEIEAYWAGQISEEQLHAAGRGVREEHWNAQVAEGLQVIPAGDFTFYDRVLDTAYDFGVVPQRYRGLKAGAEQYFAMARGLQRSATSTDEAVDVPSCEMKKWFDTNYHFIVPELEEDQEFKLLRSRLVDEFNEAKSLGLDARPVVVGPVTFLLLSKPAHGKTAFNTLDLLQKLLPVYVGLFKQLAGSGATWVQVDEPTLVLDISPDARPAFTQAYKYLRQELHGLKILLTTYFGCIDSATLPLIIDNVDGLHIDLIRSPEQLGSVLQLLAKSQSLVASLGVVDGRNVWKTDLAKAIALVDRVVVALGKDRVWIAPSCSLLHSPYSSRLEKKIASDNKELYDWLAFALEKCKEVATIAAAVDDPATIQNELDANTASLSARSTSTQAVDPAVRRRVASISASDYHRRSPYPVRRELQREKLKLPLFPTTTIGSFPQTKEIRIARQKYANGSIGQEEYDEFIRKEIEKVVRFQEAIGLDVLVHGESERNDMVEHFGHLLQGYAFTENGWVVSYGSRCVKPPIVFGDVCRRKPMTVDVITYAQSLTEKPLKGMLTGPVTMLKWSFVRDDIPLSELCKQVAVALRDEVVDLETAGIPCIQVDEPAIREGLPLRQKDWAQYLEWSVECFRLSTSGVKDETQIHTHMCYSDFNDIFDGIQALDADVITIENSKSDMKLLKIFETKKYTNEIGPGLYDIHSPRIPSVEEMSERFEQMLRYIPAQLLWINPDCGLKSRGWKEVDAALRNLVAVAIDFRAKQK